MKLPRVSLTARHSSCRGVVDSGESRLMIVEIGLMFRAEIRVRVQAGKGARRNAGIERCPVPFMGYLMRMILPNI